MPRLQSTAVGGWFPTPPRVATAITRHLRADPTSARTTLRLLDPCAGTGEAAATVAQSIGAETFGIELNAERAEAARDRLGRVLHTSAFSVRIANGAFSCLFLNPPYADDDEKRRLEHAFLTSMTRVLPPGGVLVFIIPQRRLEVSARYLAGYYTSLHCYRFPDPDFERFQQVVLYGVRKPRAVADPVAEDQVKLWSAWPLDPLPDEPEGPILTVPSVPRGEVLFAPLIFDPTLAAEEARRRGVWVQPQVADQLWPPAETTVRPLMPLRRGHLALLIAAGMLNNLLVGDEETRVLIKGRTYKEFVELENDDEDKLIEREVLRTSVAVLDLNSGKIEMVEQS